MYLKRTARAEGPQNKSNPRSMVICLLLLSILLPCLSGTSLQNGNRIVGGHSVDITEYPYQISLRYYGNHRCGGSIVTSKYVVTTAHCTTGSTPSELSVRAGSSNRTSSGVIVGVRTIHVHPSFNSFSTDYDISVLELEEELSFGPRIAAINLPAQDREIIPGLVATVTGWGTLSEVSNALADQLQAIEIPILDIEVCNDVYGTLMVTERMVCAGVMSGGKDPCYGDSGGPLVVDDELIGVASWGYGCARPNYPAVYTNVPALRYFLDEILPESQDFPKFY